MQDGRSQSPFKGRRAVENRCCSKIFHGLISACLESENSIVHSNRKRVAHHPALSTIHQAIIMKDRDKRGRPLASKYEVKHVELHSVSTKYIGRFPQDAQTIASTTTQEHHQQEKLKKESTTDILRDGTSFGQIHLAWQMHRHNDRGSSPQNHTSYRTGAK